MVSHEDMVIVDGIQYRPEDVPGKKKATDSKGDEVKTGPVTNDDMVIVNGVQYRPEDAPKGRKSDSDGTVTSKVAQPRNKARNASSK